MGKMCHSEQLSVALLGSSFFSDDVDVIVHETRQDSCLERLNCHANKQKTIVMVPSASVTINQTFPESGLCIFLNWTMVRYSFANIGLFVSNDVKQSIFSSMKRIESVYMIEKHAKNLLQRSERMVHEHATLMATCIDVAGYKFVVAILSRLRLSSEQ